MIEYLQHKKFVEENRHYMGAVWKSVRFCSLQGIGLRVHREDLGSIDKNPGSFLSFRSMLSEYDSVVKNRLNNSSSDKYTHHSIQNELITTAANIVCETMFDEVVHQSTSVCFVMIFEILRRLSRCR